MSRLISKHNEKHDVYNYKCFTYIPVLTSDIYINVSCLFQLAEEYYIYVTKSVTNKHTQTLTW